MLTWALSHEVSHGRREIVGFPPKQLPALIARGPPPFLPGVYEDPYCRGLSSYQYYGPIFLVQPQYHTPQIYFTIILVVVLAYVFGEHAELDRLLMKSRLGCD